ncbi:MAG: NIPSNAP family protein [Planctomycetes bacterium]|nr:NIPSNAP family protein [Planctomycetota bacterium]
MKNSLLKLTTPVLLVAAGALLASVSADDRNEQAADKDSGYLYELRTYTTEPGRLPALHKRFRDHTMKLFEKHGMKNVLYFTPVDGENTLVYLIAHKSREAADKSWEAFRNDPEWQRARDESERDGKIVAKVERQYLEPTDYSPKR